jgi:hypothetical protein
MPVPRLVRAQPGTATAVVSTGTYESARDGIEGRSVRDGSRSCQPLNGAEAVKRA